MITMLFMAMTMTTITSCSKDDEIDDIINPDDNGNNIDDSDQSKLLIESDEQEDLQLQTTLTEKDLQKRLFSLYQYYNYYIYFFI